MSKWILGALGAALFALIAGFVFTGGTIGQAQAQTITVYKTPWCGCCTAWIKHLQRDGLDVRVIEREDLAPVRASLNVPDELASCHTAKVDGYAIEGHVPAAEIRRLLKERPAASGLSVPGMPMGSPGMETASPPDAYDVILFKDDAQSVFASYVGRFPAEQAADQ
ncbi:MAG TPA: CopG family transcriptional regulator [Hyphomonas sp.]|uniref:DUF411 domain-containing protein n=1 Tax=uncultured Hyphomonas sp. TaxID=225298 RepID=UPI000C3797D9|nr:CopG family transcriptional regulator [Hyphomonas sp.]MAN91690.1 CopG family transcriptional regulator [Hyphomonadaceae bacterium]HBL93724.1 CopG family transcriptional regulator [Hyphomonas sp.]HCJ18856.1 CopG family transcriptional regulator [Hyphomonas sp.]|tara:strand:+ start:39031 stop:39528 length:498 start_codon:yes stop_codon:yes gene_type:complete